MQTLSAFSLFQPAQVQILKQEIAQIAPTLECIPGVAIINSVLDGSVLYMNSRGSQQLGTSLENLQKLGNGYHEKYFNPEQAAEYVPRIMEMVQKNDPAESVTFFQQTRLIGHEDWQWHLTAVRLFCSDASGNALAVLCIAHHISPNNHYTHKVERLLEELTFLRNNALLFGCLGKREKEVLRMIALGKTCQEIGEALFISNRTAETHRRNIRRKLGANTHQELDHFARAFDLV